MHGRKKYFVEFCFFRPKTREIPYSNAHYWYNIQKL